MKNIVLFICCVFSFCATAQKSKAHRTLIVTNITLIDGTGTPAQPDMTLIIVNGRITEIKKSNSVKVSKGAQHIDGRGKYVIPGLWDMHVHLFNNNSRGPAKEYYFPLFIANGVTGVREMWTKPDSLNKVGMWKEKFRTEVGSVPRIGMVGTLVDGTPIMWRHSDSITSATEARSMVKRLKGSGIDFVKVYDRLNRESYFAIADEAKRMKIPFAGHVPLSITATEATNAGQHSIEHLSDLFMSVSSEEAKLRATKPDPSAPWLYLANIISSYDEAKAKALFHLFAKNNTWHVPTLVQLGRSRFGSQEFLSAEGLTYVPEREKATWLPMATQADKRKPEGIDIQKQKWNYMLRLVRDMHRAGVKLMAGTDLGMEYIYPGYSLHDEIKYFVEAGLTPMEAIQTATKNPAEFLGIADSLGTLKKGMLAYMIILDANPLTNINNIDKINAVILNGSYLSNEFLSGLRSKARALGSK